MSAASISISSTSGGEVARRVLRRTVRKLLLSPSIWLLTVVVISILALNGHLLHTPAVAAPSRDAADQYVQALRTGNIDTFLASLSPDARTKLGMLGRFTATSGQAERRAAQLVLSQDHIDRYTRLGQHPTEDGSFVVYAIERDASDGTHTTPLVVWLDHDGRVLQSTF